MTFLCCNPHHLTDTPATVVAILVTEAETITAGMTAMTAAETVVLAVAVTTEPADDRMTVGAAGVAVTTATVTRAATVAVVTGTEFVTDHVN